MRNFQSRKLGLGSLTFTVMAIRKSFLREICKYGILWCGKIEQFMKVFFVKIVFFTNLQKVFSFYGTICIPSTTTHLTLFLSANTKPMQSAVLTLTQSLSTVSMHCVYNCYWVLVSLVPLVTPPQQERPGGRG